MEITSEDFDTLPESMQGGFVKTETGYVSAESQQLSVMQGQLSEYEGKYSTLESKLNEFTSSKEQEIEAARQSAYDKALSENDTSKLLEIEQQKSADAQARADSYKQEFTGLKQNLANEKADTIIKSLSSNAIKGGELALQRLLKGYVSVDPETGAEQYLNDDGSVSSLNREQFLSEQMKKNPVFTSLVAGEVAVNNNGIAKGSGSEVHTDGVPTSLEACKGDRKLEAAYFNAQMKG